MILVSGGNGNIGKALCMELCRRGFEVLSIGRRASDQQSYPHVPCDITLMDDLDRLFVKHHIDRIVHLAGLTNTAALNDPKLAVEINVNGSLNLMKKAVEYDIPFIYGSSVNAIGLPQIDVPVKEDDVCVPQEFYGWTKRFVEETGIALSKAEGLRFTALRIPTVLGEGQGSVNTPWRETCFTRIGKGGELNINYHSDVRIPVVHIDDLIEMICAVLLTDQERKPIYNLPCEEINIGRFAKTLMEIDPSLKVKTGERKPKGMCSRIDSSLFRKDYPIQIQTVKERLIEAKKNNEVL
ncbi:MAG: NAD(P)-dependent oxidoreductase [Erysipelotrichaceae bacterium]|nr:NAD(P)-dependent oxidoreductase [Erysipelotrichaceae bacterium]